MLIIPSSLDGSRYEILYLPVIALSYLYYNNEWISAQFDIFRTSISVFDHQLPVLIQLPESILLVVVVFSLVGSIQLHGFARIIHGPDDPTRQKSTSLQLRYVAALLLKAPVEELPEWGSIRELMKQLLRGGGEFDIARKNIVFFFPMFFVGLWEIVGLVALLIMGILGTLDFTGFVLLIVFVVLKTQDWFWSPFPSVDVPISRRRANMAEHVWRSKKYRNKLQEPESDSVSYRYSPLSKDYRDSS